MRSSGILLSLTSLPGKYGIGCMDKYAYRFIDQLQKAKQKYWQILPLGVTGYGDSPYQSFSTYAGNPYLISLDDLVEQGWLMKEELVEVDAKEVDYDYLYHHRYPLLRKAYQRSNIQDNKDFQIFCRQNWWLNDYSLFMSLKEHFHGASWNEWPFPYRYKEKEAIQKVMVELKDDILYHKYIQYVFWKQWDALKQYANDHDVQIIGDIPIYVAYDSADVWSFPQLFQLDEYCQMKAVAGCPPDGFSANGQLWGNPLYDWPVHKKEHFAWWLERIRACSYHYDVVRIDHFRGFDEYFSIPAQDDTARNGHWEKGPGMELFEVIQRNLSHVSIIAEDLGFVSESVKELVNQSHYPGMKVFQFGFDARDENGALQYQPYNYPNHCVAYTGTHDNETMMGWFHSISKEEKQTLKQYLGYEGNDDSELLDRCIENVMMSRANLCIIPMQDHLQLGNEARMNIPNTLGTNWKWRMDEDAFDPQLIQKIKQLTILSNRCKED